MEVTEKYTKVEQLLKLQSGQTPTVPVMAENERERGETALPTNPKTGHSGKRKTKIQAIQAIGRPEGKHACCMDLGTLQKSAKY